MSGTVDKKLVCRQFQRAAATYDSQAMIQHRVADYLLAMLAENCCKPLERALEIGCCTGLLSRKLIAARPEIAELVLNDLVEDFAVPAGTLSGPLFVRFLAGDIETLALPGAFDLVISSSTFHWLHDFDGLLQKLAAQMTPGACLVFSMYGSDNLREIKQLTGIGLEYFSLAEVEDMVQQYFTLDRSDQAREIFYFPGSMDILNHLRMTGVNAVNREPWTPGRLQRFTREYHNLFSDLKGVKLTYHPLYLVAHRSPVPHRKNPEKIVPVSLRSTPEPGWKRS